MTAPMAGPRSQRAWSVSLRGVLTWSHMVSHGLTCQREAIFHTAYHVIPVICIPLHYHFSTYNIIWNGIILFIYSISLSLNLSICRSIYLSIYLSTDGTPLLWTPWEPGGVSCIERCPHFRGKFILRKHIWDTTRCPYFRGVL